MKYTTLAGLEVSRVAQGCMRIGGLTPAQIDEVIKTDIENGINYFDHADIYGGGVCEEKFGNFLCANPSLREKIFVQTKCGIKPGSYDFDKEYIISCVEKSLKRLKVDYLDFLLLHRPDTLCEPERVAEAFNILYDSEKVRNFGVSNHNPYQIELLNKYMQPERRILVNQLQFSITNTGMIDCGLNVNMDKDAGINRDGMVLDYCRLNDITIQPWSPFPFGFFGGTFIGNPNYEELNKKLEEIGEKYGTNSTGMAIAWILRHPAKMQPIIGTVNPERIKTIANAADITITHDEWYELYRASGKTLP